MDQRKKLALKEAILDTLIGTMIMMPLNFIVVYICLELLSFNAFQITIATTGTLFFVAVWRKASIRLYFDKKDEARRNTRTVV
jgi:hypothetical protein